MNNRREKSRLFSIPFRIDHSFIYYNNFMQLCGANSIFTVGISITVGLSDTFNRNSSTRFSGVFVFSIFQLDYVAVFHIRINI